MVIVATVSSYFVFSSTPFAPVGNRCLARTGTARPV